MRINVSLEADERSALIDVSDDIEFENFKALCAAEFGFENTETFHIVFNGKVLADAGPQALRLSGIGDNDLVLLRPARRRGPSGGQHGGNPQLDMNALRNMLSSSPQQLAAIRRQLPALADAIEKGDQSEMMRLLSNYLAAAQNGGAGVDDVSFDPLDPSNQEKMYEQIRRENVDANLEHALEHSPESFGHVVMLYINAKVNGSDVKAFVDSGAQMTIMSKACAERCNLMKLLDTRFAGIAKGVGVQKILGRIHLAPLQIGNDYLQCTFSVLEDQEMELLLGLDMLRRHQCCVDLKRNALIIGTTGAEASFLPESELPHYARLNYEASESDRQKLADRLAAQESYKNGGASTSQQQQEGGSSNGKEGGSERSSSAPAVKPAGGNLPESALEEITKRGFTREEAARALADYNGDSKKALANLLISKLSARSVSAKGPRK